MIDFQQQLQLLFEQEGKKHLLKRGHLLLSAGETEHQLYWIKEGALKVFYVSEFEEHIIRFGYQGNIINSLGSYLSGRPSEFYLETIRKTELLALPKARIETLIHRDTGNQAAYIALLENLITQQIEREVDLLIASPAERFQRVLARSPMLFREIPLKYIAAYLRMSPETLSRIRNS